MPSATVVQAATGTYQVGQSATLNVQVSVANGQPLYGPDKNEKFYYSGTGITLYAGDGVLVSGAVVPDETGAATTVTNALVAGNNTFYAVYSGNDYVLPSESLPVTIAAAAAAPDFQIEGPGSISISASASDPISLQIVPVNGFNQTVQLRCSGLPAGESCSVPATVTPSSAMAVMLTIASAGTATAAGLPGCFLLLIAARRRRKRIFAFLLITASVLVAGCEAGKMAGSSSTGASQTYPVTITATSGAITHELVIDVTLCP